MGCLLDQQGAEMRYSGSEERGRSSVARDKGAVAVDEALELFHRRGEDDA